MASARKSRKRHWSGRWRCRQPGGLSTHARESSKNAACAVALPTTEGSLRPEQEEGSGAEGKQVHVRGMPPGVGHREDHEPGDPARQSKSHVLRREAHAASGALVRVAKGTFAAGTSCHAVAGRADTLPRLPESGHWAAMAHERARASGAHTPTGPNPRNSR